MSKILITGGAGFIGSHLAELLLQQGHTVHVIDNFSTGSRDNLNTFETHSSLHVHEGSVLDEELVSSIVDHVDQVYHLAASVGVKHIIENLVESIKNNVSGTEVVLRAAAKGKKKVLLTSTSEVYGSGRTGVLREDDSLQMGPPIKTRWSYACSKALDEYMAFAYFHEYGLPVTVVRLFNTVGPRQSAAYGMVIPTFMNQALRNKPITVFGDGQQSRCFCHVKDVTNALASLMDHPQSTGEVINIGSTEQITMNDLAQRIVTSTNSRSQVLRIPYNNVYHQSFEDIDKRTPSIEKVQRLIGFTPTYTIDEIIEEVRTAISAATKAEQSQA